jgi:hypothetical protein
MTGSLADLRGRFVAHRAGISVASDAPSDERSYRTVSRRARASGSDRTNDSQIVDRYGNKPTGTLGRFIDAQAR